MSWCRSTRRGSSVYVHVFDWPNDGRVRVPLGAGRVTSARALAGGGALTVTVDGADSIVDASSVARDAHATVLVLELA
jgi:alpha-L-fucosidase